jgi:hypothetical protein
MIRRKLLPLAAAAVLAALPSQAQEKPKPEPAKPQTQEAGAEPRGPNGIPLRVQIVITRFQGDRKIGSLPYTFVVTTGGDRARMRMGVDTPVAIAKAASEDGKPVTTSFQYRTVGTNIDCAARDRGDGRYQLNIGIENSSALAFQKGPSDAASGHPADASPGNPLFRSFSTNLDPWMRDGQSLQTIAATDPVSGEVVKIEVTLNVIR